MARQYRDPSAHDHPVSEGAVLDRMRDAGIADRMAAERVLRATLSVAARFLTEDEALALRRALPDALAALVAEAPRTELFRPKSELYEQVRREEGTALGRAQEHVDIALRALGDALDFELRVRLARALPEGIGEHLLPREHSEPPRHEARTSSPPLTTLAAGRPGSRHPLSEAKPAEGHSHSVAVNADPHGETKLSSARGLTQERHGVSLASGHPPAPDRTLGDAHEE